MGDAIEGLSAVLFNIFLFIILGYVLRWSGKLDNVQVFNTAIGLLFLPATLFISIGEGVFLCRSAADEF